MSGRFVKGGKTGNAEAKRKKALLAHTRKLMKEKGYVYVNPKPKPSHKLKSKNGGDVRLKDLQQLNGKSRLILLLIVAFIAAAVFG